MFGLLNINKPAGVTSRDVVDRVQRIVRPSKAGHAGTLDPLATGVLVVCVGQATRLIEYVQRMPKRYKATFLLGRTSDTEDVEGKVVGLPDAPRPSREQVEQALPRFIGELMQTPPAYSALKVQGKRAYELARNGESVALQPRQVNVYDIRLASHEHPELQLEILCGSGTYVRSLGRDVAASLGTAAVMAALLRTAVGSFCLEAALPPEQLSAQSIGQYLLPASRAVADLPSLELTEEEAHRIAQGLAIGNRLGAARGEIAAWNRAGRLVAILAPRGSGLRPVRNFPAS